MGTGIQSSGLTGLITKVEQDYLERTPASASMFERGRRALVAGTTGNLRFFSPHPLYFSGGLGSRMTDIDHNTYIDFFCCNGPLLLGHRHPLVESEIDAHREVGSLVVNPELAVDVAEALLRIIPCAELVRFLNSGTEAVLSAVRYARAFTGKGKVIKFYGHYHGQDDQFLVGVDATSQPLGVGVSEGARDDTLILPFGDIAAIESLLSDRDDVAAVLLDPAMHAGGLMGSTREYLTSVRQVTFEHHVVLIFDEVITGFRMSLSGAQGFYGVTPDLATFAKALAAGEKLAAVVGRADIMSMTDPARTDGRVAFQSGTGNDGTSALAAALGALQEYERLDASGAYQALHARTERLADGLRSIFSSQGVSLVLNQLGPMIQFFISSSGSDLGSLARIDPAGRSALQLAVLLEGTLLSLPCSDHLYLSFAHTDGDVDCALRDVQRVFDKYEFADVLPTVCV